MASQRPTLYLVDGYALIYRAFFAMISRPLTTSRGENTSAAWGIANFLLRHLKEHDTEYMAWVHDAGSSFRSDIYPEYKATRQKLDEELQQDFDRSLKRIEEMLGAFRIPLVTVDGYEADDVIGTLAARGVDDGFDVVIVSGDKDFYQLINDHVSLLNPGRGGPAAVDEKLVTAENASERLGVAPEQVVDYLALVGDSSDNVPGVKGIGAKTAQKLLEEYGDLESILEHASEISGKRAREALESEPDNARISRKLVTIQRDVPVDTDSKTLHLSEPDWSAVGSLFTDLEFHTLVEALPGQERASDLDEDLSVTVVTEAEAVSEACGRISSAAAMSIEVFSMSPDPLVDGAVGLAITTDDGNWYFPLNHDSGGDLMSVDGANLPGFGDERMKPLKDLLASDDFHKFGHDIKNTWLTLRLEGVEIAGVSFDTMLASFLVEPGRRSHDLSVIAREELGRELPSLADLLGKGKQKRERSDLSFEDAGQLMCARSSAVHRLSQKFDQRIAEMEVSDLLSDVELPLVRVLVEMEWTGITLDRKQLEEINQKFTSDLDQLEKDIYEEAGTDFNINSTKQLRHVLFEKLQLPVIKKTKTGPSTDADVLQQLAAMDFKLPELMLEYRELTKLKSTYIEPLPSSINPRTNRIHTRFNQIGAATGRLSSYDPNLQNIPVRTARGGLIRKCFVAARGKSLIVADYSQVELRLLAHLSGDELLIEAFNKGGDIHRQTAGIVFEVEPDAVDSTMREQAKTINFATIYGQGAFALSRQLGIERQEAQDFIDTYFERFSGVRNYLDSLIELARKQGYVQTIFGRRRYIPEIKDKNFNVRSFGERTAMNSPIQGSAADLIKVAMVRLQDRLESSKSAARILLQVHDELVVEVETGSADEVSAVVKETMESACELDVPLVASVGHGPNWLDAKK